MEAQAPEIVHFADKMIAALKAHSSKPVDISLTVEWAAIDLMGFLMLGRSFDSLEKWESPRFLRLMHAGGDTLAIGQIVLRFKILALFYAAVTRLPIVRRWMEAFSLAEDSTRARIEAGASARQDAVTIMLEENKTNSTGLNLSQSSIEGVSSILFLAGSETTATTVGGIVWLLLNNPRPYESLTAEIRSFSDEELTPKTLGSLPYLNCTIQEGLRLHSAAAVTTKRIVPPGGTTIDGHFVPEGVSSFISRSFLSDPL